MSKGYSKKANQDGDCNGTIATLPTPVCGALNVHTKQMDLSWYHSDYHLDLLITPFEQPRWDRSLMR